MVDWSGRKFVESLTQDAHALVNFLEAHKIAVVAVAHGTDRHLEVVFLVIDVGVFFSKIMIYAASTEIWARKAEGDGVLFADCSHILAAIDKNAVSGDEFAGFLEGRRE